MGQRRQARELALQSLYLWDVCRIDGEESEIVSLPESADSAIRDFAREIIRGVLRNVQPIDAVLSRYAKNWDIARMAAIDRNVLRMAAFEILAKNSTPVSVIINEAIEIVKTYSTEESGKFVNGILDKVKNERGQIKLD